MKRLLTFVLLLALVAGVAGQSKITGGKLVGGKLTASAGGGSFPTNGVLDTFNRANEGPPPSASWTGPLFPADSGLTVTSNVAFGSAALSSAYWSASFGPDVEVYATLGGVNFSTGGFYLYARIVSPNTTGITGYGLRCRPWQATEINLVKVLDSSADSSILAIDQTLATGDSVGFKIVGTTLTVYHKPAAGSWTQIGTVTDSTYSAAGKIGVRTLDDGSLAFDDFGGGAL